MYEESQAAEHLGGEDCQDPASLAIIAIIKALRLTGTIDGCAARRIAEQLDEAAHHAPGSGNAGRELRGMARSVRRLGKRGWSSAALPRTLVTSE